MHKDIARRGDDDVAVGVHGDSGMRGRVHQHISDLWIFRISMIKLVHLQDAVTVDDLVAGRVVLVWSRWLA